MKKSELETEIASLKTELHTVYNEANKQQSEIRTLTSKNAEAKNKLEGQGEHVKLLEKQLEEIKHTAWVILSVKFPDLNRPQSNGSAAGNCVHDMPYQDQEVKKAFTIIYDQATGCSSSIHVPDYFFNN